MQHGGENFEEKNFTVNYQFLNISVSGGGEYL